MEQITCSIQIHQAAQGAVLPPHVPFQSQQALCELCDVGIFGWVRNGRLGVLMEEEEVVEQGAGLVTHCVQRMLPVGVDVLQELLLQLRASSERLL